MMASSSRHLTGDIDDVLRPDLPTVLQLEVTSACNLRCAMCLVRYRPPVNRADGAMAMDLFVRLLDELPGLTGLTLQGLGEPLLHPRLIDMIRLAHARGVNVGFNSNLTLLSRARADALVSAGLDWLHVSVDGAQAPTFERIREGARLSVVLANLRGLVAAKRAAGSDTPGIRVVFVAMRRNIAELPELIRLVGEMGVPELRVQNLSHDFRDTDPAGSYHQIRRYAREQALWGDEEIEAVYDQARTVAASTGVTLRLPHTGPAAPRATGTPGCGWPWDAAYITSSGMVQPCCMVMGDDRVALGDLASQSFAEIWSGPRYLEFRRRLIEGPAPSVCQGCSLYRGSF